MNMNQYSHFGYNIFGPFLNDFTKWLRFELQKQKPNKIFFFSRDGFMMQKAYNIMEKNNTLGISQEYVYFSRNSLRRALLWTCQTYEDSLIFLTRQRHITFSEIASYYGITENNCKNFLERNNVKWNDIIEFGNLRRNTIIHNLFNEYKKNIFQISREQYNDVICYLQQIKMNGNVAIVDIGWHGSMQYYLELIIKHASINADITGYYLGINPIVPLNGKVKGYLYNTSEDKLRKMMLCFLGGAEKLFQSLEGSTDNYCRIDERIEIIKKPYEFEYDETIKQYITDWQNGALNYIEKMESFQQKNALIGKKAYMPLIKVGINPTYKETQLFRFFYTWDGEKIYFIPQKPLYKYKPKEFIHALSQSMWKTGFMKAAFRIPFPYYWIYKLIRK